MTRPFRSVVCVGLDGATFDVIDPMVAAGRLPTLAKLLAGGTRAALRSVVPPLSAPAWVSFMTGTNPGRHGVYHFRNLEREGIGATLVGSWAYKGTTIFDRASAAGRTVLAFRVPMTYPAWPVNGAMVSGFPTPDPRTTYSEPPDVGERIGPLVELSPVRSMVASVDDQAANFDFYLRRSTDVLVEMLGQQDVDLFCYVNSVTDWIAHKFWRFSDPGAPAHEEHPVGGGSTLIESFYEKVDDSLGQILDAAPDDALVVVLSDHGTGRRSTARFDTAAWLAELGLFARSSGGGGRRRVVKALDWVKDVVPKKHWLWRHAPEAVRTRVASVRSEKAAVDWSRAQAYPVKLDHHVEGVNVNRQLVGDGYEAVRDAVISAAAAIPALIGAQRREEVYAGPHADAAPDLILELDPAYEFGASGGEVFGHAPENRLKRSSATHRPDGILVVAGPGARAGVDLEHASLLDVPATLMWALGLDVPGVMDGRVITEAFEPAFLAAHPVRIGDDEATASGTAAVYSADEEEQLAAHLEELGYL